MRISTIIKGIVVLLAAVIVTAVAILYSTDFSTYKGEISSLVRNATGRNLVISGDFKPKIGLTPAVAVDGVRFANAPWGSRKDMARIKHFRAEIELLPLFLGKIRIKQIVLSGADILLETRADGTGNWVMGTGKAKPAAPAKASGPVTIPSVDKVLIENSVLVWHDRRSGKKTSVHIDRLQATADSATAPLRIAFRGRYNDSEVSLDGTLGALDNVMSGGALPVDLKAGAGGADIAVKGSVRHPLEAKGVDLSLSASGDDLASLNSLAGASLPSLGPYRASATLHDHGKAWQLKGFSLSMGKSDLSGTISVIPAAKPLDVTADLTSTLLRLEDFQDRKAPKAAAPGGKAAGGPMPAGDGRVFPAEPIPFDGLKAADAKLSLRANRMEVGKVALRNISVAMSLKGGRLAVRPAEAEIADGRISLDLSVDGSRAQPAVALKTMITKLDLGTLLKTAGQEKLIDGRLNVTASLTGSGKSVRAIMAGLNGSVATTMEKGRLDNDLIDLLSADVVKVITPLSSAGKDIRINCLVGRYAAKNGKLVSRVTLFDTDRLVVTGEGGVDLSTEKIDFLIDPKAKEVSLMKLVVPLRVGGTLASPSIYPDPGGVVKGALGVAAGIATGGLAPIVGTILSDVGKSKEDNACVAALSGKTGKQAPADNKPSSPANGIERTLEGVGKGIGQGLKGLFGK